jgi:UDP-glucose 4-epimerase
VKLAHGNEELYQQREERRAVRAEQQKRREEEARRTGDPAVLIASSAKCRDVLGWKPQHSNTEEIIKTAWNWHKEHPYGYGA